MPRAREDNGRTRLLGVVDNESDKTVAGMRAREVPNAFAVENDLMIEEDGAVKGGDLLPKRSQLLVQFNVLAEDAGAGLAPSRHLGGDLAAAIRHLAEEIEKARDALELFAADRLVVEEQRVTGRGISQRDELDLGDRAKRIERPALRARERPVHNP